MVVNGGLLIRPLGSLCPLTAIWLQSGGRNDSVASADPEAIFSANAAYLEPSGSQNGPDSEPTDAEFAIQDLPCASELIELGFPVSSSSVVEPSGALASSSASSELIEPGFSASSSSSHVVVLQGHPSGVEPAGSSSSVAALYLTT